MGDEVVGGDPSWSPESRRNLVTLFLTKRCSSELDAFVSASMLHQLCEVVLDVAYEHLGL